MTSVSSLDARCVSTIQRIWSWAGNTVYLVYLESRTQKHTRHSFKTPYAISRRICASLNTPAVSSSHDSPHSIYRVLRLLTSKIPRPSPYLHVTGTHFYFLCRGPGPSDRAGGRTLTEKSIWELGLGTPQGCVIRLCIWCVSGVYLLSSQKHVYLCVSAPLHLCIWHLGTQSQSRYCSPDDGSTSDDDEG